LKARRRERHRESLSGGVTARVAGATMVVVNPTHYAVALHYSRDESMAPRVVARGAFSEAARIRSVARHRGVPVLRHPPLARRLFLVMEDEEIPEEVFRAVAELLVYLSRLTPEERDRCQ